MRNSRKSRSFRFAITIGCAAILGSIGVVAGGAIAGSLPPIAAPQGLTAASGQETTPMPAPHYVTNAKGQTYGSIASAGAASQSPDLVLVVATNGAHGYSFASDLAKAEGSGFASPSDALAWQAAHAGLSTSVPVYKSDGTTRIGEFTVGPPDGQITK